MRADAAGGTLVTMFIALRDLRFARGRFALLGSVIALMTLMVVSLTGLTAGLAGASVSAVAALPADAVAFQRPAAGQDEDFATSELPADTAKKLAVGPGVDKAAGFGVSTSRLGADGASTAISVMGTGEPSIPELVDGRLPTDDEIVIGADLADERSLKPGDEVELGDRTVEISGIVPSTAFNHLPVVYSTVRTWQQLARTSTVTAVALWTSSGEVPVDVDRGNGTSTVPLTAAFDAVGGYASEQGSLQLMRGLLLGISALVVGAFFAVWTMQRSGDLAVVRAIGGSGRFLLTDALGQALLVLMVGSVVGSGLAIGLGSLAARVMPFLMNAGTVLAPAGAMIGVGLIGAAFSVRQVVRVDPLTALGAAR